MIFLCIPCLALLVYFLILAIFFPKYRIYVKEAWKCFTDKLKGKKCSLSFDNKMRLAFSMWLAKHNMPGLGKYFYNEKNFKWTVGILFVIFSIITTVLFVLLMKFIIYGSPCDTGSSCSL